MVEPPRFKGHDRQGWEGGLLIITSFLTGRQTPVVEQSLQCLVVNKGVAGGGRFLLSCWCVSHFYFHPSVNKSMLKWPLAL